MSRVINVALVGISGYGDTYLEALFASNRSDSFNVVGVVDPMPARCKRLDELHRRRIPIHAALNRLFAESNPDLVMISSPIHLHAQQTCEVLQNGANVLCEKPLAGSLRDGLRMLDGERNAKGFVAIGFQWSFAAAVQALKQDIMAGVFGRTIRLKTIVFFPRGLSYFSRNSWAGRVAAPDGGDVFDSPVNNATSHYLHNMLYVLGSTRETSATPLSIQAEIYRANDIENYDTAALRCHMEGGAEVLFYTSHATAERLGPVCTFEFEHATVEYDDAASPEFIARFHDGRVKRYGNPNQDRNEKIWQCIDAISTGESTACGIQAALPHAMCVSAIQSRATDIPTFPADLIALTETPDGPQYVVKGLHDALLDSYGNGLLPADLPASYSWANALPAIDLRNPALTVAAKAEAALETTATP